MTEKNQDPISALIQAQNRKRAHKIIADIAGQYETAAALFEKAGDASLAHWAHILAVSARETARNVKSA